MHEFMARNLFYLFLAVLCGAVILFSVTHRPAPVSYQTEDYASPTGAALFKMGESGNVERRTSNVERRTSTWTQAFSLEVQP